MIEHSYSSVRRACTPELVSDDYACRATPYEEYKEKERCKIDLSRVSS